MLALLGFILALLASPFKSRSRLEAENAGFRQQLIVLRRQVGKRVRLTNDDRLFFVQLYRWFPSILKVITITSPETLLRWYRAGFRRYWRWKSRSRAGRPPLDAELRALIVRMSLENPLRGAPRIHRELLKLGFAINVAANPIAEWIARQITEAFPWDDAPHRLIRDRDRVYGVPVKRRLRAMGIRDKPIARGSPWQNGFAERLIGSIRRECVDHAIVVSEAHLRRLLAGYAAYNELRTHRSLNKGAPVHRAVQHAGQLVSAPILLALRETLRVTLAVTFVSGP